MQKNTLIALIIGVLLTVGLAACGGGTTTTTAASATLPTQAAATTTEGPATADAQAPGTTATGGPATTDAAAPATTAAEAPCTTTPPAGGTGPVAEVSISGYVLVPEYMAQIAEIIVFGTITQVDPAVWNSPDGKEWWPQDRPMAIPLVYQTFYLEPAEILKGTPRFGTPVAFMLDGGVEGQVTGPLEVGDEVLVYGKYDPERYDMYWKGDAYFPLTQRYTILLYDGAKFTNLAAPGMTSFGGYTVSGFTLDELRARISAALSAAD